MASRFHTLDMMRGVAALAVFILHAHPWFPLGMLPGGYLAVDLFFALSGFVLAHAYEDKFAAGMPPRRFLLQRLIRLYPLHLAGALLGMVQLGLAVGTGTSAASALGWSGWAIASLSILLMLPSPTCDATKSIAPVNGVAWSLMFELAVNMLYALLLHRLPTRWLIASTAAFGLWLTLVIVASGSVGVGMHWPSLIDGVPRACFPFFTGVLLYRLHRHSGREAVVSGWRPWLLMVALAALFVLDPADRRWADMAATLVLLPLFVWLGAGTEPQRPALAELLGRVSYPLYAIHYPALHLSLGLAGAMGLNAAATAPWGGVGVTVIAVAASGWLAHAYDTPLRAWLTKRLTAAR